MVFSELLLLGFVLDTFRFPVGNICHFAFICRITLIPNLENSTFSGTEKITLKALEATNEIIFHVNNISINDHSISIRSTKENSSPIEITASNHLDGNRYRILLTQPMNTEDSYNLDLSFNGHLNNQLKGFFRTHYNEGRSER